MRIRRTFLGLLFATLVSGPVFASGRPKPEPNVVLGNVILKLDREASMDTEAQALLADLIGKEYGTHEDELKWGMDHRLAWGDITALAYIQATTGKSPE